MRTPSGPSWSPSSGRARPTRFHETWTRSPPWRIGYPQLMKYSLWKRAAQLSAPIFCRRTTKAAERRCGVEVWRGGLGKVYRCPALSSAGASLTQPCFRFHTPLIEPDGPVSGIRLSEKGSRCRPRETARPLGKADEAQHVV